MRYAAFDIHAVKVQPGAVRIVGEIHQCPTIKKNRISDLPTLRSDSFREAASRLDAPDVQFVGQGTADEIDERGVGSPDGKMGMATRRRGENRRGAGPRSSIVNEQRITGRRSVVNEARTIMGPIELRHTFQIRFGRASQGGRSPDADVVGVRGAWLANPKRHERVIGGETEGSNGWIDEFRHGALRQVVKCSGTDLHDPNIRFAVLVRDKRNEMAVV